MPKNGMSCLPQRQFSALTGHLCVAKQYKVRKLYVTLLVCLPLYSSRQVSSDS